MPIGCINGDGGWRDVYALDEALAVGNIIISVNLEGTPSDFTFPVNSSVWVVAFSLNSRVYQIVEDTVEHSSIAASVSVESGTINDLLLGKILD